MGNHQVVVLEVDPIRELITVLLPDDVKASVNPGELSTTKPEEEKPRRSYKRRRIEVPSTSPATPHQDKPLEEKTVSLEDKLEDTCTDMNFDFSVFVLNDGSVLKVGSICFVDSCSSPFIISRIFKSSLGGTAFVSGVRCHCEGGKVISVLHNFQVTVDCSFVRPCSSAEFCLSSVSSEVCNFVFHGQTSVFLSQERNFGNVPYLRELRRHALGAQMRQAVSSGISLHATRPSQPISLGTFEPFHDMTIFGLSEKNKFKIPFSLGSGYSLLDNLMGRGWDVKSLRRDVADCHFKFVTLLTVYLDKKNFTLKFSFSYSEAPFPFCPDYREKCKALSL